MTSLEIIPPILCLTSLARHRYVPAEEAICWIFSVPLFISLKPVTLRCELFTSSSPLRNQMYSISAFKSDWTDLFRLLLINPFSSLSSSSCVSSSSYSSSKLSLVSKFEPARSFAPLLWCCRSFKSSSQVSCSFPLKSLFALFLFSKSIVARGIWFSSIEAEHGRNSGVLVTARAVDGGSSSNFKGASLPALLTCMPPAIKWKI